MIGSLTRRTALVAVAVLLMGLYDRTGAAQGQQVLETGAEEAGMIGSMRHQMHVAPMGPNGPLFLGQMVADETAPARMRRQAGGRDQMPGVSKLGWPLDYSQGGSSTAEGHLMGERPAVQAPGHGPPLTLAARSRRQATSNSQGVSAQVEAALIGLRKDAAKAEQQAKSEGEISKRLRREAPTAGASASASASAPAAPAPAQAAPSNAAQSASSMASSVGGYLKEQSAKAGQAVQGYGDQLAAAVSKRLRRQAPAAGADASVSAGAPNVAPNSAQTSLSSAAQGASATATAVSGFLQQQSAKAGQTVQGYGDQLAAAVSKRLKRQDSSKVLSGQASGDVSSPFAALGEQIRNQGTAAVQSLQSFGNQLVAGVQQSIPKRAKRQVSYTSTAGSPNPESGADKTSALMKYLSDLGQQAQQAQAIQQLLASAGVTGSQPAGGAGSGPLGALAQTANSGSASASSAASNGISSVAQVMSQLTDLIKSTQDRNSRLLESSQRNLESGNDRAVEAAKSAQGGISSALSEMGQGLQRLANNNPNLLPDIKNLYQSVAAKLSSASSSVAQTALGNNQQAAAESAVSYPPLAQA